jgi:hypothetical protein
MNLVFFHKSIKLSPLASKSIQKPEQQWNSSTVVFFLGLVSLRKETGLSSSRETVYLLFRHKIILERDGRLLWPLVRLSSEPVLRALGQ